LKALAKKQLAPSTVVGTNGPVSSGIRTSAGTFLAKKQDDVVRRVEARMALAAGLPEANGEGMQILRYDVGQKYDPHFDYFHDTTNASPKRGGQRMATMLVYLADTESGGETTFPKARKPPDFDAVESFDESSTARRPSTEWSDCAKRSGVPVRSEQGDAVLFWSLTDAYELDPGSLHGACPVLKGEKWTAVKWMRVAKFDGGFPEDAKLPMPSLSVSRRDSRVESERCQDEWAECADWAARGWCARNPEFMIGKKGARDSKGPACPQSCGVKCA
jgi:prolyl 4-hydroxylase